MSKSGRKTNRKRIFAAPGNTGGTMRLSVLLRRFCALLCLAAVGLASLPALAQSGPSKSSEQKPANGQEAQKQIDVIAEAARVLKGPAGNPECVWLGRRVVALLWRDDMDTAFRHLDLYDRFGCPAAHIQAAFRCLIRQGPIDVNGKIILGAMRAPRICHDRRLSESIPDAEHLCVIAKQAAAAEPRGRAQGTATQPHLVLRKCAPSLLSSPSWRACRPGCGRSPRLI
jgi:hypothetical protein